jgi:hypothetical protein
MSTSHTVTETAPLWTSSSAPFAPLRDPVSIVPLWLLPPQPANALVDNERVPSEISP